MTDVTLKTAMVENRIGWFRWSDPQTRLQLADDEWVQEVAYLNQIFLPSILAHMTVANIRKRPGAITEYTGFCPGFDRLPLGSSPAEYMPFQSGDRWTPVFEEFRRVI